MADIVEVTTTIADTEVSAGRLYRTRTTGSFEYDTEYLRLRDAFALAPSLPLHSGPQAIGPLNPFSDSAPDTWGRKVQNRAAGRRLDELTLMLGVNDEGRQGATRFWVDGSAVADGDGVPAESSVSELLRVADQVERGDTDIAPTDIRRLFRATGSLGGARPKANVRLGSELWLAKFPKPFGDDWNVMAWEAAMLDALSRAGIRVPEHVTRRVIVDGQSRTILLLKRFDRRVATRVPYISAMTALEASDGDGGDWMDLVDFAQVNGADTTELWKRAVMGALAGNLDDHLRNHGFLRRGPAWIMSPAFDVNPEPLGEGNEHQLALFGETTLDVRSFQTADALALFRVSAAQAVEFLKTLPPILRDLPRSATAHGAGAASIEVMRTRIDSALSILG